VYVYAPVAASVIVTTPFWGEATTEKMSGSVGVGGASVPFLGMSSVVQRWWPTARCGRDQTESCRRRFQRGGRVVERGARGGGVAEREGRVRDLRHIGGVEANLHERFDAAANIASVCDRPAGGCGLRGDRNIRSEGCILNDGGVAEVGIVEVR
jgi:hypothetical protein